MHKFTCLPWQSEFFQYFMDDLSRSSDYRTCCVLSRRQICHKSATALMACLWYLRHTRGRTVIWAAPIYKQGKRQFDEALSWYNQGYVEGRFSFNASSLTITGPHGSVLKFISMQNPDNLRGETAHLLLIDEAAYISDEAISVILTFTDVYKAPTIYLSTPFKKSGMFYEAFIDPQVKTFDWTQYDLSEYVSRERLDYLKRTMPPSLFKCDILGQFLEDSESALFGDLQQWTYTDLPEGFSLSKAHVVAGIDWSNCISSKDYTSACVLARFDGITYEIATLRYNSGLGPSDGARAVHTFLAPYLPYLKCIFNESNSMGRACSDLLCESSPRYRAILKQDNWSSKSKTEAISKLTIEIPAGLYRFKTPSLLRELGMYTQFVSKDGRNITFGNATRGGDSVDLYHDDTVCSFAHAASAFRKGTYHLS